MLPVPDSFDRLLDESDEDFAVFHPLKEGYLLTWNPKWVRPGESLRNLAHVLAERNWCSIPDVLFPARVDGETLGAPRFQRVSLTSPISLDIAKLASLMGVPERSLWERTALPLIDAWLAPEYLRQHPAAVGLFFRGTKVGDLRYCPVCMETGFHSVLHQFMEMKCCLAHSEPVRLIQGCPSCNRPIPAFAIRKRRDGDPDPIRSCPRCGALLSSAGQARPTEDEITSARWFSQVWEDLVNPEWRRCSPATLGRIVAWELDRRRRSLSRTPTPLAVRKLVYQSTHRIGTNSFVDLVHILGALRFLEIRPRDLGTISVPPNFVSQWRRGPTEYRASVIREIRAGATRVDIRAKFAFSQPKLDECILAYLADGSLTEAEAASYLSYQPQKPVSRGQLEEVARLLGEKLSVEAIHRKVDVPYRLIMMVRNARTNGQAPSELYIATPAQHPRKTGWLKRNGTRRELFLRRLDAAIAYGRPLTLFDLREHPKESIGNSFSTASGIFGGPDSDEFRNMVRTRIIETWVKAYPDRAQLYKALSARHCWAIRRWAQDLGYLPS